MAMKLPRAAYAAMFGPTTGDRLRLADTELVVEIESDRTIYGEEVKFGGGKVIRDGMGQSQASRAEGAVDTVITNAVILDHWGIVKADIGIRDGRISGIGKAGNPDVQPCVDILIGPGTEVIAGEGRIITRGCGLCREPDQARNDRRRGHPARSWRLQHDVVRQPGHGSGRRGHHPHLADR